MNEENETELDTLDFSPEKAGAPAALHVVSQSPISEAKQLFETGEYEKCRDLLTTLWLENPFDQPAIELYATLMWEVGQKESAKRIEALAKALKEPVPPYKHHQHLFEVGYALVDMRQYRLATRILSELVKEVPNDPLINYELGFSLMCMKDFENAIKYFEKFLEQGGDFDVVLNLCVCYTLLQNEAKAAEALKTLEKLVGSDEEKLELAHRQLVLKRLGQFKDTAKRRKLNARDWFYILYGSILLRPGKKLPTGRLEMRQIASTLVVLKGLLSGLSVEEEGVEFYSLRSKPMAAVFAELLEVHVDAYRGPDRPDRCLMMMSWTTDILGPHQVFVENVDQRGLFAFAISPDEPLPIVPDIIAFTSPDVLMPWEGKESNVRELEKQIAQLLEMAQNLECDPDLIQETQEALDYYQDKRDYLVFSNSPKFANRPEYTAELPPEVYKDL